MKCWCGLKTKRFLETDFCIKHGNIYVRPKSIKEDRLYRDSKEHAEKVWNVVQEEYQREHKKFLKSLGKEKKKC